MPRGADVSEPERIDRVTYGRFRNVSLHVAELVALFEVQYEQAGKALARRTSSALVRSV